MKLWISRQNGLPSADSTYSGTRMQGDQILPKQRGQEDSSARAYSRNCLAQHRQAVPCCRPHWALHATVRDFPPTYLDPFIQGKTWALIHTTRTPPRSFLLYSRFRLDLHVIDTSRRHLYSDGLPFLSQDVLLWSSAPMTQHCIHSFVTEVGFLGVSYCCGHTVAVQNLLTIERARK